MTEPNTAQVEWRKSSRSGGAGECVELAARTGAVAIRDSKDPSGPRLYLGRPEFSRFVSTIKHG